MMRSGVTAFCVIPLLGFLAAGNMPVAKAAVANMALKEDGISFRVGRYDDGRSKPYRVIYKEDGTRSRYIFNTAGFVTDILVDEEEYDVLYESNSDLESVTLTQREETGATGGTGNGPTNIDLDDCDDCMDVWDAVCDEGVPSVCELLDYGSPITTSGEASISTFCEIFGNACSRSGGDEACEEQCG